MLQEIGREILGGKLGGSGLAAKTTVRSSMEEKTNLLGAKKMAIMTATNIEIDLIETEIILVTHIAGLGVDAVRELVMAIVINRCLTGDGRREGKNILRLLGVKDDGDIKTGGNERTDTVIENGMVNSGHHNILILDREELDTKDRRDFLGITGEGEVGIVEENETQGVLMALLDGLPQRIVGEPGTDFFTRRLLLLTPDESDGRTDVRSHTGELGTEIRDGHPRGAVGL